jgi:hypothetical protein
MCLCLHVQDCFHQIIGKNLGVRSHTILDFGFWIVTSLSVSSSGNSNHASANQNGIRRQKATRYQVPTW